MALNAWLSKWRGLEYRLGLPTQSRGKVLSYETFEALTAIGLPGSIGEVGFIICSSVVIAIQIARAVLALCPPRTEVIYSKCT